MHLESEIKNASFDFSPGFRGSLHDLSASFTIRPRLKIELEDDQKIPRLKMGLVVVELWLNLCFDASAVRCAGLLISKGVQGLSHL